MTEHSAKESAQQDPKHSQADSPQSAPSAPPVDANPAASTPQTDHGAKKGSPLTKLRPYFPPQLTELGKMGSVGKAFGQLGTNSRTRGNC